MALIIYEQKYPQPLSYHTHFRLAETITTIDGTRTRLTHRVFNTLDEAVAFVQAIESSPEFKE